MARDHGLSDALERFDLEPPTVMLPILLAQYLAPSISFHGRDAVST